MPPIGAITTSKRENQLKQLRKRLTYANVMSSIAVFLVLGGGAAFAANQLGKNSVGTKQLKKNAVTAVKIKNNAVTSPKIAGGAVTNAKIGEGAVTGGKLAAGSVDTGKLAEGAVNAGKLGSSAVGTEKLAAGAVTAGKLADGSVTPDKLSTSYLQASTAGLPIAGASVSSSGGLRKWFNRFGGQPTVEKLSTGAYKLTFPGLEGQAYLGNSVGLVSLNDPSPGEIVRGSSAGNPRIATYDSTGAAADRGFDYVLFVPGTD